MDQRFLDVVEALHAKYEALLQCPRYMLGELPKTMPRSGVYLFSEDGRDLYVGRSNYLRRRYRFHTREGSQHNQASFAFKLAREAVGYVEGYPDGVLTRTEMAAWPDFATAFIRAKAQVLKMEYRFVEEVDQTRQALLESYCTIVLRTPYNDFNTH